MELPGGVTKAPAQAPPELPGYYPQSSMFKVMPGWAFYVRHADAVTLRDVTLKSLRPDVRPAIATEDGTVNQINVKVDPSSSSK